jgi:cell shape-determining protein MreD
MWVRRIVAILIAFTAGLWDAGVSGWLPGPFAAITASLPLVVATGVFSTSERALTMAVLSGMVLDIYLPSNAGFVTLRYVLIVLIVRALTDRWLTNRSLAGVLAISGLAVLINRLILFVSEYAVAAAGADVTAEAHASVSAELIWMMATVTVVFMLIAAMTRRFLPLVSREHESLPLWRT